MNVWNTVGSQWMTVVVANTAYILFFLVRTHSRIFKTGRQGSWAGATFVRIRAALKPKLAQRIRPAGPLSVPTPSTYVDFEGHKDH